MAAVEVNIQKDIEEAVKSVEKVFDSKLEEIRAHIKVVEKRIEGKKWLNRKEAAKHLGIGASTLDRWRKIFPDFPKPVEVSETKVLFNKDELDEWMEKRRKND